uniref:hypothetical protein n=1 Tax=Chitinivorax sp. B TaxID=2502235 RepID=UPI001BB239E1
PQNRPAKGLCGRQARPRPRLNCSRTQEGSGGKTLKGVALRAHHFKLKRVKLLYVATSITQPFHTVFGDTLELGQQPQVIRVKWQA